MKKKSTANFGYRIGTHDQQNIILIWDKNLGNRSVTNDIENVVGDIAQELHINPEQHFIIYQDSEGRWDGWDAITKDFFPIGSAATSAIIQNLFPTPLEQATESLSESLRFIRQLTSAVWILQQGYEKISDLLNRPGNIPKEEIRAVIIETSDKFVATK